MHCDHCQRRYERQSVAVEAVCVVSLNYGECDTPTRRMVTARNCDAAVKEKATWASSLPPSENKTTCHFNVESIESYTNPDQHGFRY